MTRTNLTLAAVMLALCASTLAAQGAPQDGDLVPRSGTLVYMKSDNPDVLYRMFGKDGKGGWKLRSFLKAKLDDQFSKNPDSDDAKFARSIFTYAFETYESTSSFELAILDVTAEPSAKYLLYQRVKKGRAIDTKPDFLKDALKEEKNYRGIRYVLYRVPEEDVDRGAMKMGFDRFYVASLGGGLLVSNFESSMRDAIDKYASKDYSESLSSRKEFKSWRDSRGRHDLSVFVVGREVQNLIERALPNEEAEKAYNEADSWLQLREYKYIVFDFDYDAKVGGITVAASFKTRRETKLLSKLAIAPAKFAMARYIPGNAAIRIGVQLGNARTTYANLLDFARDAEKIARTIQKGMKVGGGGGGGMPPPDEEAVPDPERMKSINPFKMLKAFQDAGGEPESEVDQTIERIEEKLGEFGTSIDEILSSLGTEALFFIVPDLKRAIAIEASGMDAAFEAGRLGFIVGLKDPAKARSIIAKIREKDPKGFLREFNATGYKGIEILTNDDREFAYAITADALLMVFARPLDGDNPDMKLKQLKAMIDASTRTVTGRDTFTDLCSKFVQVDYGVLAEIGRAVTTRKSLKLDRYAEPALGANPDKALGKLTFALRLREHKDGVELAFRVRGLPSFGEFLDGGLGMFTASSEQDAYSYSQNNLRELAMAIRDHAETQKGAIDLDALLKSNAIRAGTLQTPFDKRWTGGYQDFRWITLDQIKRDPDGNFPDWVDAGVAAIIETNEKAGFRSFKLTKGDLSAWVSDYKAGFIVAYQENADTAGGHQVLYADDQVGWLSAGALKQALKLNAEGKEVPADDPWGFKGMGPGLPEVPLPPEPEREPERESDGRDSEKNDDSDNDWFPEKKK